MINKVITLLEMLLYINYNGAVGVTEKTFTFSKENVNGVFTCK